jgi:hypothetical protein
VSLTERSVYWQHGLPPLHGGGGLEGDADALGGQEHAPKTVKANHSVHMTTMAKDILQRSTSSEATGESRSSGPRAEPPRIATTSPIVRGGRSSRRRVFRRCTYTTCVTRRRLCFYPKGCIANWYKNFWPRRHRYNPQHLFGRHTLDGGRTASAMEEVLGEEVESTFGASRLPRRSTFYGRVLRETLLKFF